MSKAPVRFVSIVCIFIFAFFGNANAQVASMPTVEELTAKAAVRSAVYIETFKNLLSEEKKTFEIFDKKGTIKKSRTIGSTFLVYQLAKDDGKVAEFRNVTAVDGKRLDKTDDRAKDFFEKVVASQTSIAELDHIRDESTRYDEDFAISGLTLFQAVALSDELRPSFKFSLVGKESIDGVDTFVIEYKQTAANHSITINGTGSHNYDIEYDGKASELEPRIRGMMWIVASTGNLRREIRQRTIQPTGLTTEVVVAEDIFEYGDSDFGILTPRNISHLQYRVANGGRDVRKDVKVDLVYGKFTRPDVEVKSSDVKAKDQP